jgi:hypothetical protein
LDRFSLCKWDKEGDVSEPVNHPFGRSAPSPRALRFFISALTIAMLLVSVLAIHAMAGLSSHSERTTHSLLADSDTGASSAVGSVSLLASSAASSAVPTDQIFTPLLPAGTGCDDMCELGCLMMGILCSVSAFLAIVWLSFSGQTPKISFVIQRLHLAALKIAELSVTLPRPCLHVLSISRT